MRRFAFKLLVFCFPLALIMGLPLKVLVLSGELMPLSLVVRLQRGVQPTLFGLAYSNPVNAYKLRRTNQSKSRVIVLGTSRVMSFKAELFSEASSFYNAGGGFARVEELNAFLRALDYSPKVVILGLDQYFFNDRWLESVPRNAINPVDSRDYLGIIVSNWKQIYRDYSAGKFTLNSLLQKLSPERIGVHAIANDAGFRNDGSYSYGRTVKPVDARFLEDYRRISSGESQMKWGTSVSPVALGELRRLLAYCAAKDIHVIGFLPPYAKNVWREMMSQPSRYGYMREIVGVAGPVFVEYRFRLFDFSNLADLGVADEDSIDATHHSETAYTRMFLRMAAEDESLRTYAAHGSGTLN